MSFPSAILDYTSTWHRGYSRSNIFIRVEVERIIMLSLQPLTVFVKLQTCHKHIKFRVMFRLAPPSFGSEMPLIYTSYIISQVRSTNTNVLTYSSQTKISGLVTLITAANKQYGRPITILIFCLLAAFIFEF